jgi:PIN domain nuclease of toxin-antitoxin system
MRGLLLDTHVWLWYAEGLSDRLRPAHVKQLDELCRKEGLFVSAVSVWEVGALVRKGRVQLSVPLRDWVDKTLSTRGIRFMPLDAATAAESTQLPGELHGDPADRFLVATARVHGATLATRDQAIIDYGETGSVRVLAL